MLWLIKVKSGDTSLLIIEEKDILVYLSFSSILMSFPRIVVVKENNRGMSILPPFHRLQRSISIHEKVEKVTSSHLLSHTLKILVLVSFLFLFFRNDLRRPPPSRSSGSGCMYPGFLFLVTKLARPRDGLVVVLRDGRR